MGEYIFELLVFVLKGFPGLRSFGKVRQTLRNIQKEIFFFFQEDPFWFLICFEFAADFQEAVGEAGNFEFDFERIFRVFETRGFIFAAAYFQVSRRFTGELKRGGD